MNKKPFIVLLIGLLLMIIVYLITKKTESIFYPIIGIPMVLISLYYFFVNLDSQMTQTNVKEE